MFVIRFIRVYLTEKGIDRSLPCSQRMIRPLNFPKSWNSNIIFPTNISLPYISINNKPQPNYDQQILNIIEMGGMGEIDGSKPMTDIVQCFP